MFRSIRLGFYQVFLGRDRALTARRLWLQPAVAVGFLILPWSQCLATAHGVDTGPRPTREEIAAALAHLKSADASVRQQAHAVLVPLPCSEIGPLIAEALSGDPGFHAPIARRLAFDALARCAGEKGEVVERIMLQGLLEEQSSIVASCARGLTSASPAVKAEAARLMSERWDNWMSPGDDPPMWIVESIIDVNAVGRMIEKFGRSEGAARETALWTLGILASKTKGAFDHNPAHQKAVRNFVIASFESPSSDVRQAALESLIYVFGDDLIVVHTPDDYELNPQVVQALESMAKDDPNDVLRTRAGKFLEQLRARIDEPDADIQRILKEKAREIRTQETP